MSISLAPYLLSSIIQYLNADDLARLAQTNKAWMTYVYRSSVWNYRTWSSSPTKSQHFFEDGHFPSDARHSGAPTKQCFAAWVQHVQDHADALPRAIVQEQDPERYITLLKTYWNSNNRPCVIACHHRWYDVIHGRNLIAELPVVEQERMRYRMIHYPRSDTMNPYVAWLTARTVELSRRMHITHNQLATIDTTADPCAVLGLKWHNIIVKRRLRVEALVRTVYDNYRDSAAALNRRGKIVFDANDRLYKHRRDELLWDMTFTVELPYSTTIESQSDPLPSDVHSHD